MGIAGPPSMIPSTHASRALAALENAFSDPLGARVVSRAPGRINLLGEHTDYNEGFVLPAATRQAVYVAASARPDRLCRVCSEAFGTCDEFDLDDLEALRGERDWARYVRGVAWALEDSGLEVGGLEAVILNDLPVGVGLASSAAVEVAFALALLGVAGLEDEVEPERLARLCQRAENEYVGMRCGILDQVSSLFGQEGAALLLDCRSLEITPIPLERSDVVFVVCDTSKPRGLVNTEYNARRQQCERAAAMLGVPALRDATVEQVRARREELGDVAYRRAHHVVTENSRVHEGARALREGRLGRLGELMCAAHASLRDDYEVSCPELNAMVEVACETEGCYGARLMGAGFGGCALAAVEAGQVEDFSAAVVRGYHQRTGLPGRTFATSPSDGAGVVRE